MANTSCFLGNYSCFLGSNISSNTTTIPGGQWNQGDKRLADNPLLWAVIIFSVTILFLNGSVFVVFLRQPNLRTSTNWILASLAVSDFSVGLTSPLLITCQLMSGPVQKPYCLASVCLNHVFAISTIYHITLATLEKYMAIIHPLKHISFRKRMIFCCISSVWMFAVFVALIPLSWLLPIHSNKGEAVYAKQRVYSLVMIPLVLLVPYLFIIYMFIIIFVKASRSLRSRLSSQDHILDKVPGRIAGRWCSLIRYGQRPLVIFAAMAALFAICWFPFFALGLYYLFRLPDPPTFVIDLFIAIRYVTSIVHPLLYTVIKRDFTAAFRNKRKVSQPMQSVSAMETIRLHTRFTEGRRSALY